MHSISTARRFRFFAALGAFALFAACSALPSWRLERDRRSQAIDLMEKAEAQADQGLYEQAIQQYLKAIDISPSPQAYYGAGHCYSQLREYDLAAVYLQQAVDLAPDYTLAYYELLHAEEMLKSGQGQSRDTFAAAQTSPGLMGTRTVGGEVRASATRADAKQLDLASDESFRPRKLNPPAPGAQAQTVRSGPAAPAVAATASSPAEGRSILRPNTAPYAPRPLLPPAEDGAPPAAMPPAPSPRPLAPPAATPIESAEPGQANRWSQLAPRNTPPAGVALEAPATEGETAPADQGPRISAAMDKLFPNRQSGPAKEPVLPGPSASPFDTAGFHAAKADDFMSRGEYRKAKDEYLLALRQNERDAEMRAKLASAYLALDEVDNAEAQARRAVEIDPANALACLKLGETLYQAGRYSDASAYALQAVQIDPQNADAQLLMGDVYEKLGRQESARAAFENARKLTPESPRPLLKLGNLRLQIGDYDQARQLFLEAVKLDPEFVPAHNNLGVLARQLNDFEEARDRFRQVVDIDPTWSKAWFNLGVLYEVEFDDPREAIRCYQKYLENGGGPRADEARASIAQLRANLRR